MEELRKRVIERVKEAEGRLAIMKETIEQLRKAGEDVSELQRLYHKVEQRVQRYKRAFGVE